MSWSLFDGYGRMQRHRGRRGCRLSAAAAWRWSMRRRVIARRARKLGLARRSSITAGLANAWSKANKLSGVVVAAAIRVEVRDLDREQHFSAGRVSSAATRRPVWATVQVGGGAASAA